jgi:acetyltransferase-like isoleucine patch superfamily enzyme
MGNDLDASGGKRTLLVKVFFRLFTVVKKMKMNTRKIYWRLLGANIGDDVTLGAVFMPVPEQVSIGDKCKVEDHVRFRTGGGWKQSSISIGNDTFIGHSTQINVGGKFEIGKKCMIAPLCIFSDAHHTFDNIEIPIKDQLCIYTPIVVKDNVWIGTGAIILGGVTIEEGAVIASGAVVTKNVPPFEIWGGVPARKLKSRIQ